MQKDKPAGIYIHIPFCRSKCPYCSFVSSPCSDEAPPDRYLQMLLKQVQCMAEHPWVKERTFSTLFIGGGTPTIYSGEAIASIIQNCLGQYQFVSHPEISIETNPNTVSIDALRRIREAGGNRLSIGVQSFSDDVLRIIGRSHSSGAAEAAINMAREAGFENINLDFIYGLPGQKAVDLEATLARAINLAPEHIALYELTIEPDTPFAQMESNGSLVLPDQDELAEMEETALEMLDSTEYKRYEISNYAQKGMQCRHNVNYWQNGSYLGLGAGAFSCFDGLRVKNVDDHEQYGNIVDRGAMPLKEGECLSCEAAFRESVVMGLRMTQGIQLKQLETLYGINLQTYYGVVLDDFISRGMLILEHGWLRLSKRAFPVANQVLSSLV